MPKRMSIAQVNGLGEEEFVARFGSLYEHSPWIAEQAWNARPFAGLEELHGAMAEAVRAAPTSARWNSSAPTPTSRARRRSRAS